MPTYQYVCTQCGRDLEVQQSFKDASLTECPTCQGRLRKVFNAVGVVFKGSGFYSNDSRSESKASTGSSAKESGSSKESSKDSGSSDSGSSTSTGSDTKPAEKKSDGGSSSTGTSSTTPASSSS